MVREPLSIADRLRGERLGDLLREARGSRSITDVALRAGISPRRCGRSRGVVSPHRPSSRPSPSPGVLVRQQALAELINQETDPER